MTPLGGSTYYLQCAPAPLAPGQREQLDQECRYSAALEAVLELAAKRTIPPSDPELLTEIPVRLNIGIQQREVKCLLQMHLSDMSMNICVSGTIWPGRSFGSSDVYALQGRACKLEH